MGCLRISQLGVVACAVMVAALLATPAAAGIARSGRQLGPVVVPGPLQGGALLEPLIDEATRGFVRRQLDGSIQ